MKRTAQLIFLLIIGHTVSAVGRAEPPEPNGVYSVGLAEVDITPSYPIRLSGFGFRRTESEGVSDQIWIKAITIAQKPDDPPLVLLAVDNLGVPISVAAIVQRRLHEKLGMTASQLSITSTHTHAAPMLRGVAPTLFGMPIPDEQWQTIDRYTGELTEALVQAGLAAWTARRPSRLSWGMGTVKFAINRRPQGGPVDHDLPVLAIKDLDDRIRGLYLSYACHCVIRSDNRISGDWAGEAARQLQQQFPGTIAAVSIGCGADQNPSPELKELATPAAAIVKEVVRVVDGSLTPIQGSITSVRDTITLPFAEPPDRAEWERRAERNDAIGYHARVQLQRMDQNIPLQSTLEYPIQSWVFGDSLAMVFLPGEVVVDYSLRLKKGLDHSRLWVNSYSNDNPCYIPSERILKEGGYEGGGAMVYYDRPGPLKTGVENLIVETVQSQLAAKFADRNLSEREKLRPQSPASLSTADAAELAAQILNDQQTDALREELIAKHSAESTKLIIAMTHDLSSDRVEEYRRIPWIWRVAVAAGKRKQIDQMQSILDATMPMADQPLRDWQAVVIGGGLINGIGLTGGWPQTCFRKFLDRDSKLQPRWNRCLSLAAKMADDESVAIGTRYDALRIIALDPQPGARTQLVKYLAEGIHDELQMGAISGLSDLESDDIAEDLIPQLPHFQLENRGLAISALLRREGRSAKLLESIAEGQFQRSWLDATQQQALTMSNSGVIRERARELLGE